MTEFRGEYPDLFVDRALNQTVQDCIDAALINSLRRVGVLTLGDSSMGREERDTVLKYFEKYIEDDNADPWSRLSPEALCVNRFEAHELKHLFPGQWGAISNIMTLSRPEPGSSGARLYKSPMKYISLMVGSTKKEVEDTGSITAFENGFKARLWEILIQPDSPALIIDLAERWKLLSGHEMRSATSSGDGGLMERFQLAQRINQTKKLGLFQILSPVQCRELITLIDATRGQLGAA